MRRAIWHHSKLIFPFGVCTWQKGRLRLPFLARPQLSPFPLLSVQQFLCLSNMEAMQSPAQTQDHGDLSTRILPVKATNLGNFNVKASDLPLEEWDLELSSTTDAANMRDAADKLRQSDVPIAFPTETVYGLGADATRSSAVKGIYRAKQRPSDNPLIIHVASLNQLRRLLTPNSSQASENASDDPIPVIYHTLIQRFWPGPLTIILPNPEGSTLAPEVTAGLSTFGARMPRNLLALALIRLADVPVAAPSANASTKPSPTAAEHVLHDLDGRIELILDGGLCDIGVESTVVDGLSSPPSILRPGGIGLDQIRSCPGWEETVIGYRDVSEKGVKPRAPGMKYRHYSPKAPVLLIEAGGQIPNEVDLVRRLGERRTLGLVRTKTWPKFFSAANPNVYQSIGARTVVHRTDLQHQNGLNSSPIADLLQESSVYDSIPAEELSANDPQTGAFVVWDMLIGPSTKDVARGLFSALRTIDKKNVDAIIVEGIDDTEGDIAAAVMNRLRKAAEVKLDSL